MTRQLAFVFAFLVAAVLLPPVLDPLPVPVRRVHATGEDVACPPSFAYVVRPDRSRPTPRALLDDLAYAADAAGPIGSALLLTGIALVVLVVSLWSRGVRAALRRVLVTYAVGIPLCVGLLYVSCFLDGRNIHLGPEAAGLATAGLHTQSNRSTGLLSPAQLVDWHFHRGYRVLNVSDKDDIRGAVEAADYARDRGIPMLVTVGEEWHGRPDLVLVHAKRAWSPQRFGMEETIRGVQADGGAVFVAHPWAKLKRQSLEEVLAQADGTEVVNGVIHGGDAVLQSAQQTKRSLLGVTDYKYGPHVDAVTLLPGEACESPRGVVWAIRNRSPQVVYAVPGGTITGATWDAATLVHSLGAGLRSLLETPRPRRTVWVLWLAGFVLLWWLSMRRPPDRRIGVRTARLLLAASCAVEFALPLFLGWRVKETIGSVPVPVLLGVATVVAIPLLAASASIAWSEQEPE